MINYNISLIIYSYILEFENLERRICAHIFIDVQKKSMGKDYTVGSQVESWQGNMAQSLTFIVTADCNLRCKYCYITHKSNDKRMSFEVAQKFIDYILESPIKKQKAVILDFIGGEPLLEVELIDSICDSYKLQRRLNRNFLSLGITLLFHIHKGIIGCRQALDFLAFRYFFWYNTY